MGNGTPTSSSSIGNINNVKPNNMGTGTPTSSSSIGNINNVKPNNMATGKSNNKAEKRNDGIQVAGKDSTNAKRGSNDATMTAKEAAQNAKDNGFKDSGQKGGLNNKQTIYENTKGGEPKYIVQSKTSHTGDSWKGYNHYKDAQKGSTSSQYRIGSYDMNMKKTGK